MIRRLLGLAIVVVAGLVAYNLYFGTAEEQENARGIVNEVKDLGKASWDLLKSEKEKMEAGKYDEAADKFKEVFDKLKGIAKAKDDVGQLTKIDDLEAKRLELERKLEELDRPDDYNSIAPTSKADKEQEIEKDLKQLYEETERLMKDMERN
ncbi:MAG: hypothetical protein AAF705_15155 [Bacteroidota bacterium]